MRCPDCGGLNPDDAQWCGQCLRRFTAPPRPESRPPAPPTGGVPAPPEPTPQTDPALSSTPPATAPRAGTKRGAFAVTEEGILWTCAVCGTENPMELNLCPVCGTSFAETLREPEPERPARDPNMAALVSLFFAGAGHGYLGLWGEAIGRGVMWGFVLMVFLISAVQGSLAVAFTFGVVGFGFWIVCAHDAYREAAGERNAVLLRGKMFMYLMLALLMLLFVLLILSFFRARGAI